MNEDEFYDNVRKECEAWEKTEQGQAYLKSQLDTEIQKTITNNQEYGENVPIPTEARTIRQRKFGDFYANIIPIELELIEDYYLLFKSTRMDNDRVIQTLINDGLSFLSKDVDMETYYILFFDRLVDRNDKLRVLGLLSKEMKVFLELVEESIISPDFDPDLIATTDSETFYKDNNWADYFYFKEYFNTKDYKDKDNYNYYSLPANHLEIIQIDERRNKYNLTKTDKRIQVIQWN